jgi:uncharacterized protein (TIGR00730 family)
LKTRANYDTLKVRIKETMKKNVKPKAQSHEIFDTTDFLKTREGRAVRILGEFLEPGVRFKHFGIHDTIVFFGSARTLPHRKALTNLRKLRRDPKARPKQIERATRDLEMSQYYEDAVALSARLAQWSAKGKVKYTLCSGGGPGIMEATNRGAHSVGASSIGLNIYLPFEQQANPYISEHLNFEFHYFFIRKFWFVYLAKAILIFPGGLGTLDEMMEVLTLVQTGRITKKMVIVLYGRSFWSQVINLQHLVDTGMVSAQDLSLFEFADTVDEAYEIVTNGLQRNRKAKDAAPSGKNLKLA